MLKITLNIKITATKVIPVRISRQNLKILIIFSPSFDSDFTFFLLK